MSVLIRLWHARSLWKWAGARTEMSRGNEGKAVEILLQTNLPNGYKQIALAQLGNCYLRMGRKAQAQKAYTDAIDSELSWGGRQKTEVSKYIVAYSKLFLSAASAKTYVGESIDNMSLYEELLSLNVSSRIKALLPLPPRSTIRQHVGM